MKRRHFVSALAGAGAALLESPWKPRFKLAQAQSIVPQTLLVIFQRGGCDGLNTVVPYGDAEYYNLRPTIGIPAPVPGDNTTALDLDGFFGLHPAMQGMHNIWNNGHLAVFPTIHYPNASRSHFTGQEWIESGRPQNGQTGWLNRHLQVTPSAADLRAVGIGGSLPQSLQGNQIVSAFSSLGNFSLNLPEEEEAVLLDSIGQVYGQPATPGTYQALLNDFGQVVINDLSVVAGLDVNNYTPANGAVYPNSTFGRQLRDAALMIKAGIGLEIATVNIGGWDTHSNQGTHTGRQASRFTDLSSGIEALYTDLGIGFMNNVLVLVMTEFGRTSRENASFGTDHGNASAWFVVGTNIQGGIHMGTGWPGLAEEQLDRGRYLADTVDFRDLMGDIAQVHLGTGDLSTVIPAHDGYSFGGSTLYPSA